MPSLYCFQIDKKKLPLCTCISPHSYTCVLCGSSFSSYATRRLLAMKLYLDYCV